MQINLPHVRQYSDIGYFLQLHNWLISKLFTLRGGKDFSNIKLLEELLISLGDFGFLEILLKSFEIGILSIIFNFFCFLKFKWGDSNFKGKAFLLFDIIELLLLEKNVFILIFFELFKLKLTNSLFLLWIL